MTTIAMRPGARCVLEEIEAVATAEGVVRPSVVQGLLLDLWAQVDGPVRGRVEEWISASPRRHAYERDELLAMVDQVRRTIGVSS